MRAISRAPESSRDLDAEECPTTGRVVDLDRAAMQLDDAARDREAKARPAGLAREERLEDLVALGVRHAGTSIADLDHEAPCPLADGHGHWRSRGDRVLDEVHEHLAHASGVERPRRGR